MPDQPLQYQPTSSFALFDKLHISSYVSTSTLTEWALYAAFAFWALYTLIAIYHWLKYSHASWVAFPAIAAHLFISFALMTYALSGTGFFTAYLP
jgi:hypothetical protein